MNLERYLENLERDVEQNAGEKGYVEPVAGRVAPESQYRLYLSLSSSPPFGGGDGHAEIESLVVEVCLVLDAHIRQMALYAIAPHHYPIVPDAARAPSPGVHEIHIDPEALQFGYVAVSGLCRAAGRHQQTGNKQQAGCQTA